MFYSTTKLSDYLMQPKMVHAGWELHHLRFSIVLIPWKGLGKKIVSIGDLNTFISNSNERYKAIFDNIVFVILNLKIAWRNSKFISVFRYMKRISYVKLQLLESSDKMDVHLSHAPAATGSWRNIGLPSSENVILPTLLVLSVTSCAINKSKCLL